MPAPADLVHQTSSSTGTGNLTLAAVNGKRDFATVFSTGGTDVFDYFISNRNAAEWEVGTGHMSDSTTLVRDTVVRSSNSNSAVSFTSGTLDVTNDVPADDQLTVDDIGVTVQGYDADLAALAGLSSTGMIARTGAGTVSARTITGANGVAVTNGDGVSGAPVIAVDIANATDLASPATNDEILLADTSNSGAIRKSDIAAVLALAGGGLSAATQAEQESASSTSVAVTPGRQQYHPSAPKCWAYVTVSGGTPTLQASYNITSITDTATGRLTITIATDFSSSSWAVCCSVSHDTIGANYRIVNYQNIAAGSIELACYNASPTLTDPASWSFSGFGDQA